MDSTYHPESTGGLRSVGGAELSRVISASHLSWHFDPTLTRRLEASVATRSVGALRLAWVRVNAWAGERTSTEIQSNPEPYLTMVMPLGGTIVLATKHTRLEISAHELAIWDSRQPLSFSLSGPSYEQLSVLVPQRILRASPDACAALHCARVDNNDVLSELCVQHMTTLAKFLDGELRHYEMSLSELTRSLFDAVIASRYKGQRDAGRLLTNIEDYIESYIADDSLSPGTIADAFEISTRYLHKLFERSGRSVGRWILARRLERSAQELLDGNVNITHLAFKWGFKDLGHYSRAFKNRFGVPPSRYKRTR